jgi:tRNA uridine 5-carboxymethylaminomethyl modification enzyme
MFTSRAEFRLSLRADNADQRLTPMGIDIGCLGKKRKSVFVKKSAELTSAKGQLDQSSFTPRQLAEIGLKVNQDGSRRTGFQLLAFPDVGFSDLLKLDAGLATVEPGIREQIEKDALYANYIERQQRDVEMLRRDEGQEIPLGFDFDEIDGLSNELKAKLNTVRPSNLAQAGRIDGMTPAALTLILARLRHKKREKSA